MRQDEFGYVLPRKRTVFGALLLLGTLLNLTGFTDEASPAPAVLPEPLTLTSEMLADCGQVEDLFDSETVALAAYVDDVYEFAWSIRSREEAKERDWRLAKWSSNLTALDNAALDCP